MQGRSDPGRGQKEGKKRATAQGLTPAEGQAPRATVVFPSGPGHHLAEGTEQLFAACFLKDRSGRLEGHWNSNTAIITTVIFLRARGGEGSRSPLRTPPHLARSGTKARAGGAAGPAARPRGRWTGRAGRAGEAGRRAPPSSAAGCQRCRAPRVPAPAASPPAGRAAPRCPAGGVPARPAASPRERPRVRLVRLGEIFLPTPCRLSPPPSRLRLLLLEPCPPGVSGGPGGRRPRTPRLPSSRARQVQEGCGLREPRRPQPGLKLWLRIPGLWAAGGWGGGRIWGRGRGSGGGRKPSPLTLIRGCGRSLRAKVGVRLTCTSCASGLGGRGGWARRCPQRPGGLAGREEEAFFFFFPSFLVTILQLDYGRNPGLDAVRFKAVALTPY
uniref:Uncharacterized protein n=1 Tax=Rangifer tarandus platyrhynchus TaxID=3082113 RepID=A0ACB0FEG9_RANTA|nr:unnamed protein product [Rangifer tarandus platyrhynchus]